MSLNVFEKRLHEWVVEQGGSVQELLYARSGSLRERGQCRGLYLTPKGAAKGLVVIAHATGNDLYFPFVHTFRQLLEQNYRVFSFDLDGHGQGSTHLLSRRGVDGMLPAALEEAIKVSPGVPVHLLGQSLGALLCLRFLAMADFQALDVQTAVLLSTPVSGRILARPLWGELYAAGLASFWQAAPTYGYWGLIPAVGSFKRDQYPLRFADGEGGKKVSAYAGFVDDLVEESQPLLASGALRRPCLFLYGSLDALTPPEQAGALVSQLPQGSTCEIIAGETHFTLALNKNCMEREIAWFDKHRRL